MYSEYSSSPHFEKLEKPHWLSSSWSKPRESIAFCIHVSPKKKLAKLFTKKKENVHKFASIMWSEHLQVATFIMVDQGRAFRLC